MEACFAYHRESSEQVLAKTTYRFLKAWPDNGGAFVEYPQEHDAKGSLGGLAENQFAEILVFGEQKPLLAQGPSEHIAVLGRGTSFGDVAYVAPLGAKPCDQLRGHAFVGQPTHAQADSKITSSLCM
jgi:hypothetical protein